MSPGQRDVKHLACVNREGWAPVYQNVDTFRLKLNISPTDFQVHIC